MPQVSSRSIADRAAAAYFNTHPRLNGGQILTPLDILEGQGNFTKTYVDGQGYEHPEGFVLGRVEQIDGRYVYIGTAPSVTTRQNAMPIGIERPSFLANQPIIDGHSPPSALFAAKLPQPEAPTVTKEQLVNQGYPGSSESRPYWYGYTYVTQDGKHSNLSPLVNFQLANGQSFKGPIPRGDIPEGITKIGLWLSIPNLSGTPVSSIMRLQRVVDLTLYPYDYYDFTGPYRYGEANFGTNATGLAQPNRPLLIFKRLPQPSRPGNYFFRVSFTNERGETLASEQVGPVTLVPNPYWGDENEADYGSFIFVRSTAPVGATGWQAYIMVDDQWNRVWSPRFDYGRTKPWPLSISQIPNITGWPAGDDGHGKYAEVKLISADYPTENTTSLADPDSITEAPTPFGASVPPPGTYFVRVTETVRGLETVPSAPVQVDLGTGEVMRIAFSNPVNAINNANFTEVDVDGMPLGHQIDSTNGTVEVQPGELVLATSSSLAPATPAPSYETPTIPVRTDIGWRTFGTLRINPPHSGTYAGGIQIFLKEVNAAGVVTSTLLFSALEIGEHQFNISISPAGSGNPVAWRPDTKRAAILYWVNDVAVSAKNLEVRIGVTILAPYNYTYRGYFRYLAGRAIQSLPGPISSNIPSWGHGWYDFEWLIKKRRRGRPHPPGHWGTPINYRPPPELPSPVGPDILVAPPPDPPEPPEPPPLTIYPYPPPDSPLSSSETLETLNFGSGLPGGDWLAHRSPADSTTTLAASSGNLISKDEGSGSSAHAYLSKVFIPDGSSQFGVAYEGARLPDLPVGGQIRFGELRDPRDDSPLAWFEAGAEVERARLSIVGPPTDPGNVEITLDGTVVSVPVVATKEVVTLALTSSPTAGGYVGITLDSATHYVPIGSSQRETAVLNLGVGPNAAGGPATSGYITIFLNGIAHYIWVHSTHFRSTVFYNIRTAAYPGWTVTYNSTTYQVVFTRNDAGSTTDAAYSSGTTSMPATMTTTVQGGVETTTQLAARIRERSFPRWSVSGTGSTCIFTAVVAGDKVGTHSFGGGGTGTIATLSVTTQGAADTPAQLATRIRSASMPGDWVASGSSEVVDFTAGTPNPREAMRFNAGGTGVVATAQTITQGSGSDLVAVVEDSNAIQHRRRIITGLTTTQVFDAELIVTGAGSSKAAVQARAALGATLDAHVWLSPEIDLSSTLAGEATAGVTSESGVDLSWELQVDRVRVTGSGTQYYRLHDDKGNILNQIHHFAPPTQPIRQDLLFQEYVMPVIPGRTYTIGAFLRWAGVTNTARPLYLALEDSDGRQIPLGCITEGLTGSSSGWEEKTMTFTVPENHYELILNSKDIGPGVIVIQELAYSLGDEVLRGSGYALSGYYRATHDISTPQEPQFISRARMRTLLDTEVQVPENTEATIEYSSSESEAGPYSEWSEDVLLVPDNPVIQAHVEMSGDGANTPEISSFSPRAEYMIIAGAQKTAAFLKADRTELIGGSAFLEIEEWSSRPEIGVRRLPGGRIYRQQTYEPVGYLPPSTLQVFSKAARIYIEERWGTELFCVEIDEQYLLVKLSAQPEFTRTSRSLRNHDGDKQALYIAGIAACEVVEVGLLAS